MFFAGIAAAFLSGTRLLFLFGWWVEFLFMFLGFFCHLKVRGH